MSVALAVACVVLAIALLRTLQRAQRAEAEVKRLLAVDQAALELLVVEAKDYPEHEIDRGLDALKQGFRKLALARNGGAA